MGKNFDNFDNENYDNDNELDNDIELYYEEISHIVELLNLSEKLENDFFNKINYLWDIKFKSISEDVSHNIYIDTDNILYKNKFITLMKNSSYYKKLLKFRYKLEKQKDKLTYDVKQIIY